MGADIHFFVEKYSDEDFEGPKNVSEQRNIKLNSILEGQRVERWISADKWNLEYIGTEDEHWDVPYEKEFYNNRNYYLFSMLADVRNYRNEVEPICEPKGIPEDASDGYKYVVDRWNGDGHSHTYFTLSDLMDIDWSKYNQEWIQDFFETIEKMKQVDPDPKKVRAVFFFDN
jgi:hypothetical protein